MLRDQLGNIGHAADHTGQVQILAGLVALSHTVAGFFGYDVHEIPLIEWVSPILGTVLFFYSGVVFLRSARHEIAMKKPGMMTLISLAITVAFIYSWAVSLGLTGMDFWWELATLITIMVLGHWLEMKRNFRIQITVATRNTIILWPFVSPTIS